MYPPPPLDPRAPSLAESDREADEFELRFHEKHRLWLVVVGLALILTSAPMFFLAGKISIGATVLGALVLGKGVDHHTKAQRLRARLAR